MKTYPLKHNAVRAARKALGPEAIPGVDFEVFQERPEAGWAWRDMAGPPNSDATERALNAFDDEGPAPNTNEAVDASTPEPAASAAAHVDQITADLPIEAAAIKTARAARKPKAFSERPSRKAASRPAKDDRKPAKAPPAAAAPSSNLTGGKRAQVLAAAAAGVLPTPPDFSAKTHERYRGKLAKIVALVDAGDLKELKAMTIPTYDSSVAALARYRGLAVTALEAQAAKG